MPDGGVAFPQVFDELASVRGASPDTLRAAFDAIFAGAWTPVQIAAFVVTLRLRGEDADTIAAAATAMRAVMIPVDHGLPVVVDTCGTGGDGKGSLNISTAAALVVAAAGLPVAKHGNRSVSSRTGSADVLEALDVPIDVAPARHPEILRRAGITFLFAPAHHPALRYSGPARRELAVRTVFNALGPVANPASATHQLIGAYEDRLRPILAQTLNRLGSKHAWVVRGVDGLDEISPFGPTRVTELAGGALREREIAPEDFGIAPAPEGALDGGHAAANAARIRGILGGDADPAQGAVAMNAGAAIAIGRERTDGAGLREATAEALDLLRSGRALRALDTWRAVLREGSGSDTGA
ncbi:Anthranilate phosphoribosyltransferase [Minicystis rosea]|nr:Anthranilate phosphoribosyltransferase [Minicystis rosea]